MDSATLFPEAAPIVAINRLVSPERLKSLFAGMAEPGEQPGAGIIRTIIDGTRQLRIQAFCPCDQANCPWCATTLEPTEWPGSAHTLLTAPSRWSAMGYVHGHGAPMLRYVDPDAKIDIRIWWYKHVSRDLTGSLIGLPDWASAIGQLENFVAAHAQRVQHERAIAHMHARAKDRPELARLIQAAHDAQAVDALYALYAEREALRAEVSKIHQAVSDHSIVGRIGADKRPLSASMRVRKALIDRRK